MKLLMSAFACAPEWGSEPEVGWRALLAAAAEHDVWVMTQPHMADLLAPALGKLELLDRVTVVPVEPATLEETPGLLGLLRTHRLHDAWQRNAAKEAVRLHAAVDFDLVHHVTLAAYWMRVGVASVNRPLVIGPVGGGVEPPLPLLSVLGWRGLLEAIARTTLRRVVAALPFIRGAVRDARLLLVQNKETAAVVGRDARILSNALCVTAEEYHHVDARGTDVVLAARLVPWKAGVLAVRAMRYVRTPGVRLRVFGDGSERTRMERAVARWGLADRVVFEGKVPRPQLIQQLAAAGAVIHPSLHDEGGTVLAEALMHGTPVVCLDHGGPAHVVSLWPQTASVAVPPHIPAQTARLLAAGIDRVLAAPNPVPSGPLAPVGDFTAALHAAYAEAVDGSGPAHPPGREG
jgi:glycosyltransferase involved in cell wall biosynthesis